MNILQEIVAGNFLLEIRVKSGQLVVCLTHQVCLGRDSVGLVTSQRRHIIHPVTVTPPAPG